MTVQGQDTFIFYRTLEQNEIKLIRVKTNIDRGEISLG